MSLFTNNESYKHKCAKKIFKQWCESGSWKKQYGYSCVPTKCDRKIGWRSNRDQKAWLDYPIVIDSCNHYINSAQDNWDEIWEEPKKDRHIGDYDGFVPNYTECIECNLYPISVI